MTEEQKQGALSLVAVNPTKKEISISANNIAELVREGHLDPIELLVRMEATKALCEETRALIEPQVLELVTRTKEPLSWGQAKIEAAEVGVKYDYSANDEWNKLKAQETAIADKRKLLEDQLKKIPAGKVLVDEDTGETLTGAIKTSKSSFKVTLSKT